MFSVSADHGTHLFQLNGEPAADRHGFPARADVPGKLGVRSVQWLDHLLILGHLSISSVTIRYYR